MKIQFSENDIRYRLTQKEFEILQKECLLTLSVSLYLTAEIRVNETIKKEYILEKKEALIILTLHPSMVDEIPCDTKNGLVFQQESLRISVAIDLKVSRK